MSFELNDISFIGKITTIVICNNVFFNVGYFIFLKNEYLALVL
jgi:hypothetical protein